MKRLIYVKIKNINCAVILIVIISCSENKFNCHSQMETRRRKKMIVENAGKCREMHSVYPEHTAGVVGGCPLKFHRAVQCNSGFGGHRVTR